MIKNWQQFEIEAFEYLKSLYEKDEISFYLEGASNSNTGDIRVEMENGVIFYIEAKQASSQFGQFVILKDRHGQLKFSSKNKSELTHLTKAIMEHINKNIDEYENAGTRGKNIDVDESILYGWAEENYKSKNVKYFISKNEMGKYVIFPLEKIRDYLSISATCRIKGSGSGRVARRDWEAVREALMMNRGVSRVEEEGGKMMAYGRDDLNGVKFLHGDYNYYFSKRGEGKYEIRRLSNTRNMTVIFSATLKPMKGGEYIKLR